MTASTEPRGGLDLGWSSGEDGWGDAMNANLLRLSRLGFHPSVLSATTTAPPGSPISGSGYIIPSGATGAWAGKTGQVAVWDGAAWAYAAPRDGWTMHVDGAGLTTYDNGIWSQANVVTAAQVGAEPYAGAPAQTSFWRSTAAGVRAWVQLVAADITDLATTLAAYLTKANPTFTGRLTGPTQYLEADEQILLAIRRPAVGPQGGRIHGIAYHAQTLDGTWREFGRVMTYIGNNTDAAWTGGMRLMAYKDGAILQALEAGPDGVRVGSGLPLQMGTTTVVDASRNITGASLKATGLTAATVRPATIGTDGLLGAQDAAMFRTTIGAGTSSLALGSDSTTAHRGDHGTTAYSHSQATGNPHGTTATQVGALPELTITGAVDFNDINNGDPCIAYVTGSSYSNAPSWLNVGEGCCVVQGRGHSSKTTQIAQSTGPGGIAHREQVISGLPPDNFLPWENLWGDQQLPVAEFVKPILLASSQAAFRAAIGAAPLAGAEIMIHSDFGRSATTDVWQSAFTNNTASGLQLAANTTATGTEIIIEQVVDIPADGGAAAYQVYIGPQLTGEQSPTGSTYSDVIDPSGAGEYGAGKIQIRIELIGSGTSIVGYVSSRFETGSSNAPFVRIGQITVNGTIANSIDVRFNPDSQTAYIIRRNRVFRRNP